jgi:hypothetical protein
VAQINSRQARKREIKSLSSLTVPKHARLKHNATTTGSVKRSAKTTTMIAHQEPYDVPMGSANMNTF